MAQGRWYEDLTVGEEIVSPGRTFSEADILDFAWRYDPQPFHIDKPAAEAGPYGGLIASGWHLGSVAFRLFTMTGTLDQTSLGSPGMDELRWLKPVRPGDTIHVVVRVEGMRPSRSKPDRGLVPMAYRVVNQEGETVMTMRAIQLMRRRESG